MRVAGNRNVSLGTEADANSLPAGHILKASWNEPWPRPTVRRWLDWPWQLRWAVLVAYAGFITWVSLSPAETFSGIPAIFLRYSKVAHFLLYGVLVLLARWAMAAHWAVRPAFLVVVVGASAYGTLMEVLQGALVRYHRSFEFGDIVANTLGALCFWWISRWMFLPSPAPPPASAISAASRPRSEMP